MTAVRRPGLRLILCLLCLLLAGGCSMVRVGYDYVDRIAAWMVVDYFDLNADQRDAFDLRFRRIHEWHRSSELPEYVGFLTDIQSRLRRGLVAADVNWIIDGSRQRYARIATRAAPDVAGLLAGLTNTQAEHFARHVQKDNDKFLSENRTLEDEKSRRAAQRKRALSQIRDWTGSLTDAQETRITALLLQTPLADRLRHEDRLRRQREFLALLARRHEPRDAFTQQVRNWLVNWESGRTPEQDRAFAESWQRRAEFLAAVNKILTPEQRQHAIDRLQHFIDDFRQLSGRPQRTATQ